jgi:hypothetical protein
MRGETFEICRIKGAISLLARRNFEDRPKTSRGRKRPRVKHRALSNAVLNFRKSISTDESQAREFQLILTLYRPIEIKFSAISTAYNFFKKLRPHFAIWAAY